MGEVLDAGSVVLQGGATTRDAAIDEAGALLVAAGAVSQAYVAAMHERETSVSTYMGNGLAIPHGRLPGLEQIHGFFAKLEKPIDFDSIDDRPVDLIFLLLAPEGAGADHLKALARISRMLRGPSFCEKLRGTNNRDALYALLSQSPEANPSLRAAS